MWITQYKKEIPYAINIGDKWENNEWIVEKIAFLLLFIYFLLWNVNQKEKNIYEWYIKSYRMNWKK